MKNKTTWYIIIAIIITFAVAGFFIVKFSMARLAQAGEIFSQAGGLPEGVDAEAFAEAMEKISTMKIEANGGCEGFNCIEFCQQEENTEICEQAIEELGIGDLSQ